MCAAALNITVTCMHIMAACACRQYAHEDAGNPAQQLHHTQLAACYRIGRLLSIAAPARPIIEPTPAANPLPRYTQQQRGGLVYVRLMVVLETD